MPTLDPRRNSKCLSRVKLTSRNILLVRSDGARLCRGVFPHRPCCVIVDVFEFGSREWHSFDCIHSFVTLSNARAIRSLDGCRNSETGLQFVMLTNKTSQLHWPVSSNVLKSSITNKVSKEKSVVLQRQNWSQSWEPATRTTPLSKSWKMEPLRRLESTFRCPIDTFVLGSFLAHPAK